MNLIRNLPFSAPHVVLILTDDQGPLLVCSERSAKLKESNIGLAFLLPEPEERLMEPNAASTASA